MEIGNLSSPLMQILCALLCAMNEKNPTSTSNSKRDFSFSLGMKIKMLVSGKCKFSVSCGKGPSSILISISI